MLLWMVWAALGLASPGVTPSAGTEPLVPSGKWVVDYQPNMCVLSHDFGSGAAPVTVGFRPYPMTQGMEVALVLPGRIHGVRRGKGQIVLKPSGQVFSGSYTTFNPDHQDGHAVVLSVDDGQEADFIGASGMTIDAGPDHVSIAPNSMAAAFKAVDACDDDLLKTWGIDPQEEQLTGRPAIPEPSIANWITADDYPTEAILGGLGGTVTAVWAIGVDGKVRDCRVVVSSNVPVLDQATCQAISKRGNYRPALGKDGQPMVSHNTRRVIWAIPQ